MLEFNYRTVVCENIKEVPPVFIVKHFSISFWENVLHTPVPLALVVIIVNAVFK